ncbi:MAG: histidine phosphatase family protein [Burkholderiaceae bacterium]
MMTIRFFLLTLLCSVSFSAGAQVPVLSMEQAAARVVDGGFVLMMRHSTTVPGFGDPPQFTIGQCETQRNLSDAGRSQAQAIGKRLRDAGIHIAQVRNSQWCRCRETAELAFGKTTDWPALNSFFADRSTEPAQTSRLQAAARSLPAKDNVMWVTHQVNISAALGTFAGQGEIVAAQVRDGSLQPVFRIAP